jgi:hypothetical protein
MAQNLERTRALAWKASKSTRSLPSRLWSAMSAFTSALRTSQPSARIATFSSW